MAAGARYWAFLSYSHADTATARWLHRAMESYVVPRRLVGRPTAMGPSPRRFQPIFRDRAEFAADADLRERVRETLERSAYLIVVCSPAAASSPWVEEEVVRFKALYGEARVLAIIARGEPYASFSPGREDEECFPPALRWRVGPSGALGVERTEPIAADLRPAGDGRRLAVLKLVARMLEVGLDDLVHRDSHRRHNRLILLAASSTAVAMAMGGLAVSALLAAREARDQRNQAEGLVAFMLGDLRQKLEPLGRLDLLDAVGSRAMEYYGSQRRAQLDERALGQRARVLHLLGDIQEKRGNLAAALEDFLQADATTSQLLARNPADPERIFNHAQSVYYVGNIANERGQDAKALQYFRDYNALPRRLAALDPANPRWQTEVADAETDLATLLLKHHRGGEALAAFRRALTVDQALAATSPRDRDRLIDLAQAHAYVSDAEAAAGSTAAAIGERFTERAIYLRLLRDAPDDTEAAEELVVNRRALAELYLKAQRLAEATEELVRASRESVRLMATDRDNTLFQGYAVSAFTALGQVLLRRGATTEAAAAAERADALAEALVLKDPTVRDWQGIRLGRARLLQIEVAARAARDPGACRSALAPAAAEYERLRRLAATEPGDLALAGVVVEAAGLARDSATVSPTARAPGPGSGGLNSRGQDRSAPCS